MWSSIALGRPIKMQHCAVFGPQGQLGDTGNKYGLNGTINTGFYHALVALWHDADDSDVINVSVGTLASPLSMERLASIPFDAFTTGEIAVSGTSPDGILEIDNMEVRRLSESELTYLRA